MHALKIALFAMLVVAAAAHANGRNEGNSHSQGIGRGGIWAHFQELFSRFKGWIHHDSHPGGGDSGGDVVAAPEPATMLMIGAMGGIIAVRRRSTPRA